MMDESFLDGEHALFLEQLYEQYQQDPASIDPQWQAYFQRLDATSVSHKPSSSGNGKVLAQRSEQLHVSRLINAYRYLGHLEANTNPLGDYAYTVGVPQLMLEHHGLENVDPDTVFDPGTFNIIAKPTLGNIVHALRETYVRTIGFEYMHILDVQEKRWLQKRIEPEMGRGKLTHPERRKILEQLTAAEGFEQYLHRRYVGQKRFGLEGGESLIPLLQTLIHEGGKQGLQEIVIGMAHRGRLNVLTNVLCKPAGDLFGEFEGKIDETYTGDVKYHKGFSCDVSTEGGPMHLVLAFNPSHLEIVSPVMEGSVRARQDRREDKDGDQVLGISIHGDAAFAGQGVVMETFNMAQTRGYRTRGTIHIVINNQIGFTTSTVSDSRSTYYPTDVAKMINAPIFHVNGDDPEAVVYVTQVALEYRQLFQKDVVIDLVCYRRLGHNEADEPNMTQPVMYSIIRSLPSTRAKYALRLAEAGVVSEGGAKGLIDAYRTKLSNGGITCCNSQTRTGLPAELQTHWKVYVGQPWRQHIDTTCTAERIQSISARWISNIPADFVVHPRVLKVLEARAAMGRGEQLADWGFGENLAYATLVEEGFEVRLSGQDCGRGTFSHRHAVLHHQQRREQWIPLQHTADFQAKFTVIDSVLSEEAVLAFEYGYATAEPDTLVIWEAQFGDFVNGAQVVIDQFISSGEQKWQRLCGLVMFLPHGLEGQGPEHSSARLERFVQLAAQENMHICIPSNPAQVFHMLRRQMMRKYRKPLIVFTPKSLLRHPLAVSPLEDFTLGQFEVVLDDVDITDVDAKEQVKRVILCSGKVFYDLLEERRKQALTDTAIIRLEQLYPFPAQELVDVMEYYPNVKTVIWCQEEPVNQGAWNGIKHRFEAYDYTEVVCVSRPAMAAPAVGSLYMHQRQQQALVREALGLNGD
ncbi:2-oxoglutarate dehydrogenase E1 component [Thiothrix caldifontis]|uniref:oxoglutarate dehydrogenase (succinyl-transferring) n=1 Tax=Thiothrix caldifontis TaxID=525918 RepID=A0A1H3Y6F5_9GAMM|nr:2-oxoglutarate dehydrogenase E1 component [Thiothrix caldifontis]SEA07143.1 2-oxoglutarate dehydrogenase E1 component [Thiothrix caldifontis]